MSSSQSERRCAACLHQQTPTMTATTACERCGHPFATPTQSARQSGQASEPRNHRAKCRSCGYGGWTWLFNGKRYCRGCAPTHGFTDPLDDCKAGIKPCEACSACRMGVPHAA